jgi:cell division protein FtsI (penicillin-binding protein 3)
VAGSVFREISDKIYATNFYRDFRDPKGERTALQAPEAGNGFRQDIHKVLGELDVRVRRSARDEWIKTRESGDTITYTGVKISKGQVPDVRGMSLRDAMYLLENSGYRVSFTGKGKVLRQSPQHGERYFEGQVVSLEMNM